MGLWWTLVQTAVGALENNQNGKTAKTHTADESLKHDADPVTHVRRL